MKNLYGVILFFFIKKIFFLDIMDEVGTAIQHSDLPNFRVMPFLFIDKKISFRYFRNIYIYNLLKFSMAYYGL